ncbi:ATP-binding cassette domain-containing protein [Staphylococcus hominis]|uniref:ATP-binding cassette domain-containing protein n=1 Tax=Staphylococcus hominis TaxID=1290 RepID=UPI0016423A2C|nr:ABC transporter ATP-binding protein [Staphylococcus hominis]
MTNRGIYLKAVSKKFQDFQLEDINIEILEGKIGFLLGHNGDGKTTILNILSKNIHIDKGNISDIPKNELGVIFDENHLPKRLSIEEYKKILPYLFNNWNQEDFYYYINNFNLPLKKPIEKFSRGMKIKLNICIILSYHPKYLLLDEITSGLDPLIREEVLLVIKKYVQSNNATAILTTHILDDVLSIADYIFIINQGTIKLNTLVSNFKTTEDIKKKIRSIIYKE